MRFPYLIAALLAALLTVGAMNEEPPPLSPDDPSYRAMPRCGNECFGVPLP